MAAAARKGRPPIHADLEASAAARGAAKAAYEAGGGRPARVAVWVDPAVAHGLDAIAERMGLESRGQAVAFAVNAVLPTVKR